jgi:hypothetical protein
MIPDEQNMKVGPDARDIAKSMSGAQNMKIGPDALGTSENESGSAKHENGIGQVQYRRKRVRVCKI